MMASRQIILDDDTRSDRKPWSWTSRNKKRSADIQRVMEELRQYWPLTERQIYYRLISSTCVDEPHWQWAGRRVDVYGALTRVLKWMRIDDHIPMESITDEHRIITQKLGYSSTGEFISSELRRLGNGYSRCNAQKQSRHIEVWIEKAALLHIVEPVADEFCRRVVVCKGYQSITFQAAFYERAMEAIGYGMVPTVLYFGDWDPAGVNMVYAAVQTLTDELGLDGVEYHRCGLNPEHFPELNCNPVPLKNDTRNRRFIEKYGPTAYELDALHPERLQSLVRDSIREFTDMSAYNQNLEQEDIDLDRIEAWRDAVAGYGMSKAAELGIH